MPIRFLARHRRRLVRYLASLAMVAVATVVAVGVDSEVTIPNLSLVFVVPVIIAAVSLGLGPSLCSAILGALAYNFFLTEPRYTLRVDDPANIWAIGLLFVVGCIASAVASTSRRRALEAALREGRRPCCTAMAATSWRLTIRTRLPPPPPAPLQRSSKFLSS